MAVVESFYPPRALFLTPKTVIVAVVASVTAVKPDETPETLWGKDIPEPTDAFEANGFLMRRVRLTRPRRVRPGDSK
jgi:hypothetical protein